MPSKLLQVLSHPVKLVILKSISAQPEPLKKIAQKADITAEEAKVHLDSLNGAGLVDKGTEGTFSVSPYGQLILSILVDFDFVARYSEDFRGFDLSLIPVQFVERLGDLKDSKRIEGTVSNIQSAEQMVSRAGKKISVIANEVILDAVPVIRDKVSKGAEFRFIIDQTFKPPSDFKPNIPKLWRKIWKIPAAVVVTDKEGVVFFLNRKLNVDYTVGFTSEEPEFIKWCEDLIDHLWKQGEKLQE